MDFFMATDNYGQVSFAYSDTNLPDNSVQSLGGRNSTSGAR